MLKSKLAKRYREKCWDFVDKCGELLIIAVRNGPESQYLRVFVMIIIGK
jgi:hypothetical protein